jgi:hypothetical protein
MSGTVVSDLARESIEDALDLIAESPSTGDLITQADYRRLQSHLFEAVNAAVARVSVTHPVATWRIQLCMSVVTGAVSDGLDDWNQRRMEILRVYVDPAIAAEATRQGNLSMALAAQKIAAGTFEEPGCCTRASLVLIKSMRRSILEALDRPPIQTVEARHATAEALASISIRDYRRNTNCGCS